MLIPVRCFTCGKVLAGKYTTYRKLVDKDGMLEEDALDLLGFKNMCCRGTMMTNVDLIDTLLLY